MLKEDVLEEILANIELPTGAVLFNSNTISNIRKDYHSFIFKHIIKGYEVDGDRCIIRVYSNGNSTIEFQDWHDVVPPLLPSIPLKPFNDAEAILTSSDNKNYIWVREIEEFHPCWRVKAEDRTSMILDMGTGEVLAEMVVPTEAYAFSGQTYDVCQGDDGWQGFREGAATAFEAWGLTTISHANWTPYYKEDIETHLSDPNVRVTYIIAHGSYSYFNISQACPTERVTNNDITTWLSSKEKMFFAWLGQCDGMCSTGYGSFSYAYRKGSMVDTVTVGYCSYSPNEWGAWWDWQPLFFSYVTEGETFKDAFDLAMTAYPECTVMQFCGDENFDLTRLQELLGLATLDSNKPYLPIEAFTLDFNNDGTVLEAEGDLLEALIGKKKGESGYDTRYDIDFDGHITSDDLEYFDARLTTYNNLTDIRAAIKSGQDEILTWPQESWEDTVFSCMLMSVDENQLKAFTGEFDYINDPTDIPGYSSILNVFYRDSLRMRNNHFEDWTGGLPIDDETVGWTTQSSNGTISQETTIVQSGLYSCKLKTTVNADSYAGVYQSGWPLNGPGIFLYRDRDTLARATITHYFATSDAIGKLKAWWDWGNGAEPIKATVRKTGGFPDQTADWQEWNSVDDEDVPSGWHVVPLDATKAVFYVQLEGDASDTYTVYTDYTFGECGNRYVCEEFGRHMMLQAYKALGYGYLLYANSSSHAYNLFWIGGDWHDLNNWRVYEPGQGKLYNAANNGMGSRYKTEEISFPEITTVSYYPIPNSTIHRIRVKQLIVDYSAETVSYLADGIQHRLDTRSFEESGISVPTTFDRFLGATLLDVESTSVFQVSSIYPGHGVPITIWMEGKIYGDPDDIYAQLTATPYDNLGFQWGETTSYGDFVTVSIIPSIFETWGAHFYASIDVATMPHLAQEHNTYHCRVAANGTYGWSYGDDITITLFGKMGGVLTPSSALSKWEVVNRYKTVGQGPITPLAGILTSEQYIEEAAGAVTSSTGMVKKIFVEVGARSRE